jgi:hypothetical protein
MDEKDIISVYERMLILGAETMRKAVWNGLDPILQAQGYGGHAIASIFKDSDLLYEITEENLKTIFEHAQDEYKNQRRKENGIS